MAGKDARTSKGARGARKRTTRAKSQSQSGADEMSTSTRESAKHQSARTSSSGGSAMPDFADAAKNAKLMTPAQAIELYKANAALALSIINTAIEGTARLHRKQLEGEQEAREFQQRHAKQAAQARDAQALVAAGQGAAQEAMERSMRYWSEMFDLIVEIQKRLFALLEEQADSVPGVKETRAAMAMLPDMTQMRKVVEAMQGVVSSSGSAFESMQRVMNDFTKLAQTGAPR
ncbi:MAG TPA: phasin family protein [Casimicrobiaceae bacterium]|nr:phasin family protein [Casimicrobiaceae bacterium]